MFFVDFRRAEIIRGEKSLTSNRNQFRKKRLMYLSVYCRRVYIINKVRANIEIHLGISGEKIEINPVITGKGAGRFWNRQRAVSYHMDNIAWCELTEIKGSKTTFTLVYTANTPSAMNSIVCKNDSYRHEIKKKLSSLERCLMENRFFSQPPRVTRPRSINRRPSRITISRPITRPPRRSYER